MRLVGIAMIATAVTAARADPPASIVVPPEVIEVRAKPPPIVAARPAFDVRRVPPYSDRAMLGDYWASAWLLLDVSASGAVTRVKLLARPGHDLDAIAIDYALGLRLAPLAELIRSGAVQSADMRCHSCDQPPSDRPLDATIGPPAPAPTTDSAYGEREALHFRKFNLICDRRDPRSP